VNTVATTLQAKINAIFDIDIFPFPSLIVAREASTDAASRTLVATPTSQELGQRQHAARSGKTLEESTDKKLEPAFGDYQPPEYRRALRNFGGSATPIWKSRFIRWLSENSSVILTDGHATYQTGSS
jgi:hypothetical protein